MTKNQKKAAARAEALVAGLAKEAEAKDEPKQPSHQQQLLKAQYKRERRQEHEMRVSHCHMHRLCWEEA